MKEEQDVSETAPPEEESKTKKFIRIAFALIFMAFFALLLVMAALKKYGT